MSESVEQVSGVCRVNTFSIPTSLSEIDESSLESVFNVSVNDNETVAAVLDDVTIQRTSTGKATAGVESALLLKPLTAHSYAENNQENQRTDHDLIITGSQGTINYRTVSKDMTRISLPSHFGSIKHIYNMEHYMYVDIILKILYYFQISYLIPFHTSAALRLLNPGICWRFAPSHAALTCDRCHRMVPMHSLSMICWLWNATMKMWNC